MSISVLYCLADAGQIGWWVLWVFLLKECYLVAGASVLFSKNYVVKSDYFGKTATFSFILSTCLLLPWHGQEWLAKLGKRAVVFVSAARVGRAGALYAPGC